jgi:hypothetical protein
VLIERTLKDAMGQRSEKVVVQCKHYAHSGKAIGDKDVGVWENAMKRHKARGYLLVTDTRVTENLSRSFREFTDDDANTPRWAGFWDVDDLISHLNKHAEIRNTFLPADAVISPIADLVNEVRTWLQSIRYDVSAPQEQDLRTFDMVATLEQGTIKQRILIRCIGGEVSVSDVQQLRTKLNRTVPQGWLISDRRISADARQRVRTDETLRVFSLSELLKTMIWGPYVEALTDLINRDRISDFYVDLHCYKLQIGDGDSILNRERYSSLDSYIDEWLSERGKMHISLLAEFGAGKTWFCRHYANLQLARFLRNPANERLPLLVTLRMFSKATTAQQLINDALLEQYQLPFIGSAYEVFQRLNLSGKLLLILDGFDEMARKVDYQTVVDNFWELAKLVEEGSKVILTSRTEYFRWAKESEKIFGGEEFGRRTIVLQPPSFEVLYLEPLSDLQIRDVIAKRVGSVQGALVADKIMSLVNLAEMARKPVLLELLLVALEEVSSEVLTNPTQVYLYATNKLLLRNITAEKTFTSTSDKVFFLCELACEMLKTNELRMHYRSIPERIKSYFGDQIADQHELDSWDYDLRAQTLLHRDAAGYYEFAHKSLAEYFVALKFAAEIGCLDQRFLNAYTEGDGQPSKLAFMEQSLDVSRFPLPSMNFEVATFFAQMAGDKLATALPSHSEGGNKAVRFAEAMENLMLNTRAKGNISAVDVAKGALKALARKLGGQASVTLLFANELVTTWATDESMSLKKLRLSLDTGLGGRIVRTGESHFIEDVKYIDSEIVEYLPKIKSLASVPFKYNEKNLGILNFMSAHRRQFKNSDLYELQAFCERLAEFLALVGWFRESWKLTPVGERPILALSLCV